MNEFAPRQTHQFLPSAAAHADGPGPDRDPSARADHHEPAGDRLPRPGVRRDDGGAEVAAALRLPDQEPADLPDLGPRLGRHGVLLRQPGRAGRQGDRVPQRRVRRPHDRERRALRRHRRSSSRTSGASRSIRNKLEDALKKNPDARVVAFVHAETSTGVQSDAKTLVEIAHKHDALTIVDAVTSLGGTPVLVDEWKVDAIYSASQKCLSCTPGLSPVSFSERVVDYVKARKDKIHSLVHGHEPAARLLGRDHPHLSPHRADQFAVRAARGAAADQRGRARELLGAPPAPPRRAQGRPGGDGAQVPGEAASTSCRR